MSAQTPANTDTTYWIHRQAAIDSIRAFAEKQLERFEDAENGWDRENQVELADTAACEAIQADVTAKLDERDITLFHRIGDEVDLDTDTMARSDARPSNNRIVCRPAAMWSSRTYGTIVVVRAITQAW